MAWNSDRPSCATWPVPPSEEEVGQIPCRKAVRDLAGRLCLRDARGEGFAPLREDIGEMRPQWFALRRDLKAQVPDEASQCPLFGLELSRDDIEVATNPTPRRERSIAQRRLHDFPEVVEILIQHLA